MIEAKFKKNATKVCEIFAGSKKVATFATAIEGGSNLDSKQKGFFKSFEKSFQIFWWFEKLVLPLQPLSPKNESRVLKGLRKKSLKNLAKRFGGYKKGFTFAPLSASKKRWSELGGRKISEPKTKMFL